MQKVQTTTEYGMFKFMPGNRPVLENHMKKVMGRMKIKNMLPALPVLVNEKYEIVDGQHRFAAAKELGLPISYIIEEGATIDDVQSINTATKTWSPVDFERSYVERKYPEYIRFQDFRNRHQLVISSGLKAISQEANVVEMRAFKKGLLKTTPENYETGRKVVELMKLLRTKAVDPEKYYLDRQLPEACSYIINKIDKEPLSTGRVFDYQRFLKKIEMYTGFLVRRSSLKELLRDFEDIYNFRTTEKYREHLA